MNKSLSFENTRRLLERKSQVHDKIEQLMFDGICQSIKEATSQVNKAVYEMAEKEGCSIWDICFNFIPEYSYVEPTFKIEGTKERIIRAEGVVKLVPMELEFEKGPGYWKDKYLWLKEKIQNLIDEKDDGKD